jgi:hypothetical protein
MKTLLILALLVAFGHGQGMLTAVCAQVGSHSTELDCNGGGRTNSRIGNGSGYYHMLILFDFMGVTLTDLCTLVCAQRSSEGSGGADYDSGVNPFNTTVSTVKGTWVPGSANMDPVEGEVCYQYRAYSATTPTLWEPTLPNSTLNFVSLGQLGSHMNSTGVYFNTEASGLESWVALDVDLIADLMSGEFGGLRISRAVGQSAEATIYYNNMQLRWDPAIYFNNLMLRWDPAGNPVTAVSTSHPVHVPVPAYSAPNPFTGATSIFYQGAQKRTPVSIYDLNGRLIRTLFGESGRALWDGTDRAGRAVSQGMYLYRVQDGKAQAARVIQRVR